VSERGADRWAGAVHPFRLRLPPRGRRISRGLVALSSSAILAVYAAGYMETRFPDDQRDLQALAAIATAGPGPSTPPAGTAPVARPTPPPLSEASPYRDGAYPGTGRGPHGTIDVEVVIEGGLIVSAEITECGTRYPCDRIVSLPPQVIELQGIMNITRVTGATDSTYAYVRAVNDALRKAAL